MEKISIIVPAWKEKALAATIHKLAPADGVEMIIALADGDDITKAPPEAVVARSARGRAIQMNAGARAATGRILLFLHADTDISTASLEKVRTALIAPGTAGGAYRLKITGANAWLGFVAAVANLRSSLLGLPYGDQALFVSRETFDRIGGFEETPILEDVLLAQAVRKLGKLVILDEFASTSARRWEERGMVTATVRNWAIMAAWFLGAAPETLARWFRR